jgi:aspartate 1-decarboxylase
LERRMLKSKIHRATVSGADLNYEGSITIDANLMKSADILSYEVVAVWNVTNGNRFETYAIEGPPGSGVICINGAAARLAAPRDVVIIASFIGMADQQARHHQPKVVFVDENNLAVEIRKEHPGLA